MILNGFERENMKRELKSKFIILFLLVIVVVGMGIYCLLPQKKLELKGMKEVTIALNDKYQDAGVNIDDVKIEGKVNTQKEGKYILTYTYKDQSVQRTIKVVDKNKIVINLNGCVDTYVKQGNPYMESGCHAIDRTTGKKITQVKTAGNVDTSKVGNYQITYEVTQEDITVKKTRNVHVVAAKDFKENTMGIPVLMYHYVYTKNDMPKKLNSNYILDTDLEEQLKYLTQNHYYYPSYQELVAYVNGKISLPEKSVILTFDDGQKGFLKYGIPLLEKYKVPATSFVIGTKDGAKKVKQYASEYISFQSHSYDMHKAGGYIGHGGIISAFTKQQILADLKKSYDMAQNSEAFAYPFGDVTDIAKEAVQESNTICAFTTHYGKVKKGADVTCLPRVRVIGDNSLKGYIHSLQ